MAITLNATLQTAQDGVSHRPAIELVSSPAESVIPFRGNNFNQDSTAEYNKEMIVTSTGRLLNFFVKSGNLYLYYTNIDKTEWKLPVLIYNAATTITRASACELANGNIGVIVVRTGYHLEYMIISQTGTVVTGATTIASGAGWIGKPSVITLANGDYFLVYGQGTAVPVDTSESYYIYHRTSTNFTSWGSATLISLSGFSLGHYKDGCNLLQIASSRIFLHFDYLTNYTNEIEINNIYQLISDDNGSTWTNPVAITSYTVQGKRAMNPSAAEKGNGNISIVWQLEHSVIYYDDNLDGWPAGEEFFGGGLQYNETTMKLIIQNYDNYYSETFKNVCEIDVSDNSFVRYWDMGTSPKFHSEWDDSNHKPFRMWPEGNTRKQSTCELIIHGGKCLRDKCFCVQNLINDTITYYHEGPVNGDPITDPGNFSIGNYDKLYLGWDYWDCAVYMIRNVSENDRRIYLAMADRRDSSDFVMGYIDADAIADPITGLYEFTELICDRSTSSEGFSPAGSTTTAVALSGIYYIDELSYFVLTSNTPSPHTGSGAGLAIINSNGEYVARYNQNVNAGMPYYGVDNVVYCNGALYFSFKYHSSYPDQRGICRLDLNTEAITYHEPSWFTCTGECGLVDLISMGDDQRIAMICNKDGCDSAGIAVFDTTSESWEIFNKDSLPGMYCSGAGDDCDGFETKSYGILDIQYDLNDKKFLVSYVGYHTGDDPCGIIVFSELGAFSILRHSEVTLPDSNPTYSTPTDYSYYDYEYGPSLVIDSDGYSWITWYHMTSSGEYDLMWSNTIESLDLHDFINIDHAVKINWNVQKVNQLTVSLSNGHLFDPLNSLSLYSVFLKMGRILTLKLGEIVSSVEYLQDQGEFVVKQSKLKYSKGYPSIEIIAEDIRTIYDDTHVTTSQYWNGEDPKTITENLLIDHGGLAAADYDIPTYSGSHNIFHQFVDMTLSEALQLIMDHFGYYPFVNVEGKYQPRKINLDKAVDHTYTEEEIIEYTPDTSYATFINRVTVTGMSNVYSEVLYEEESVTRLNGTIGHWGGDKDLVVWYSNDHKKTCRYPRLEIIQSTSDFQIWGIKAGGGETVSLIDDDEQYLVITIDAPNLIGILIAAVAALLATGAAAIACDMVFSGWCGAAIYACMILCNLIMLILGAIANYSYVIWARPIGHERKSFEATANDIDFQRELKGKIVLETIDDPFCYSIASCQTVADFELSVVMAQRNRLGFKKIAHLQDEVGDKLRINHPYSGAEMDVLVTDLKRTVWLNQKASIIDDIKGWHI